MLYIFFFFFLFFLHSRFLNFDYFSFLSGSRSWISSYECGFLSRGIPESSFSLTYFVLLVFFVIFDLEVSLLLNLPLQFGMYHTYYYYSFFLFILSFGYLFEILCGYSSWAY